MRDINKWLAELEAMVRPLRDVEAEHLFMLLPPDVQAYNLRVFVDVLKRLPADSNITAWLNECAA